tara:strand:- start:42 stop:899 length:858 start_codon:yes stop_codon:yes gene_type:complete
MATVAEKRNAMEEFRLASEREEVLRKVSVLDKIKNVGSWEDFKKKFSRRFDYIRRNTSFTIHEWIVSLFYGKDIRSPFAFQTSPEDVEKIINMLESSRQIKISRVPEKRKRCTPQMNETLYARMGVDQTWFEIKRNVLYDNFIKKIAPVFRNYLKSPFAVVSLTAWKTKPNMGTSLDSDGNRRGPNELHLDGYPPGHFKCIVYLKPLNDAHGRVQYEGEIVESEKPGCSLMFTAEKWHKNMPGNSEDRYCFEMTVMRTVVEVDMLKYYPGAPDSIHLKQAYHAYI